MPCVVLSVCFYFIFVVLTVAVADAVVVLPQTQKDEILDHV